MKKSILSKINYILNTEEGADKLITILVITAITLLALEILFILLCGLGIIPLNN
jgi:hypothetical protein